MLFNHNFKNQIKEDLYQDKTNKKTSKPIEKQLKYPQQEYQYPQYKNYDDKYLYEYQKQQKMQNTPNVLFFQGKIPTTGTNLKINDILKWKGDYYQLEKNHEYIQWIFPNCYQSQFNQNSYPLTQEECVIFKKDQQIAEKFVEVYEMFLDFLGLQLCDKISGAIQKKRNYEQRIYDAMILHTHNHLRIQRILCCLNNIGFRIYAISLLEFFCSEIRDKNSILSQLNKPKHYGYKYGSGHGHGHGYGQMNIDNPADKWLIYGTQIHKNDVQKKQEFQKYCFQTLEFCEEPSVYFLKQSKF